jgi:hypothetical protein
MPSPLDRAHPWLIREMSQITLIRLYCLIDSYEDNDRR